MAQGTRYRVRSLFFIMLVHVSAAALTDRRLSLVVGRYLSFPWGTIYLVRSSRTRDLSVGPSDDTHVRISGKPINYSKNSHFQEKTIPLPLT